MCARGHPAARWELAGPCHLSLESQASPFQGLWVPPNSEEAFVTICEHQAEVQEGRLCREEK